MLIAQTWRVYLDGLPENRIAVLPVAPVLSIAAVRLFDADGAPLPLLSPGYALEAFRDPPRLVFAQTVLADQAANGVEIDVVAGFGEAGEDVPGQFGRAILVLCAHWHGFRGAALDAAQAGIVPAGFDRLLAPYRQVRL
jgi:uncharacterized phiE125 gp8 family phage protein